MSGPTFKAGGRLVEIDFDGDEVGVTLTGEDSDRTAWLSKEQAVALARQILSWAGVSSGTEHKENRR